MTLGGDDTPRMEYETMADNEADDEFVESTDMDEFDDLRQQLAQRCRDVGVKAEEELVS